MKISKDQIKIIHTAKSRIGLKEENYRDLLSSFGVSSSKDLSRQKANELIRILETLGFQNTSKKKTTFTHRIGYATPAQVSKIQAMWLNSEKVKNRDFTALNKFIKRIAGVDNIEWLRIEKVEKVIKAIESL